MDTALKLARWRLERAVRAMGWVAIGGVALAIFADVGVTVLVILNSLRLLRFDRSKAA